MVKQMQEVKIKKRSLPKKYDEERRLFIRTIEDWGAWAALTPEEVYRAVEIIVNAKTQYEARFVFHTLRLKVLEGEQSLMEASA